MFTCDECGEVNRERGSLTTHIRDVHGDNRPFTCDVCDKGFTKKSTNLTKHIRIGHQHQHERCFKCELCGSAFGWSGALNQHMTNIHKGVKYACDECEKLCGRKGHLSRHIQVVHMERHPFECVNCGAKFAHSSSLKIHTTAKHEGKFMQCDECDEKFARKIILIVHITSVHQKLRQFRCGQCQAAFNQKSNLATHKRNFHLTRMLDCDDFKYACDECEKLCGRKGHLSRHIQVVHMERHPFECVNCGAKFAHSSSLKIHTTAKHEGKFMQCDECDEKFARKIILIVHITSVHQKLRQFRCGQCQAAFNQKSNLATHKRNFHLTRMLDCDDCSEIFATKVTLADHCLCVHVHLGYLKCPVCYKQFGTIYGLWRHKKSHG